MMSFEHFPPGTDVAVHVRAAGGEPFCYRARTLRDSATATPNLQLVSTEVFWDSPPRTEREVIRVPRRLLSRWEGRAAPTGNPAVASNHVAMLKWWLTDAEPVIALLDLLEWSRTVPDALVWPDDADPLPSQIFERFVAISMNKAFGDVPAEYSDELLDWRVADLVSHSDTSTGSRENAAAAVLMVSFASRLGQVTSLHLPMPVLPLQGLDVTPAQKAFAPLAAAITSWRVRDLVTGPESAPDFPAAHSRFGIPTIRSPQDIDTRRQSSPLHVAALGRTSQFDVESERDRVTAMRRWGEGQGLPNRLVPGDISAIRTTFWSTPNPIGIAAAISDAVPYFIPTAAIGMLEAEPPSFDIAHDLLMPHDEMLVIWADPLELPFGDTFAMTSQWAQTDSWMVWTGLRRLRLAHRFFLTGLLMFADPATRRPSEVSALVAIESVVPLWDGCQTTARRQVHFAEVVASEWQDSDLAGLVDNVLALVDYSLWDEPEVVDLPTDPKQRRKALKQSKTRRGLLRGGGVDRLRVMALGRTAQKQARTAGTSTGEPRTPHLRRGHWRRQRVGPRDAWWHETRYIGPVIVNADLLGEDEVPRGRTIWMVPKART